MKVLHLPTPVGGNSAGLAHAERLIGLDSTSMALGHNFYQCPVDIDLKLHEKSALSRAAHLTKLFFSIRNHYDVFHFNFGSSLLDYSHHGFPLLDLPFYPKNKKLIMTYNGCDARQKYITMDAYKIAACHEENCTKGFCNSGKEDRIRRIKIAKASKHIHHMFALNPDLLKFLPEGSTFLPYTVANWDRLSPVPYHQNTPLRVVHIPTNSSMKGSHYIRHALERLAKRYPLELVFLEGLPQSELLEEYAKADLVVDQVLLGWYGAASVEAMALGKPVAVFVREEDLHLVPSGMAKQLMDTIIHITPFTIEQQLEPYLRDPSLLVPKSKMGVEYVQKWHDPASIAKQVKAVYDA